MTFYPVTSNYGITIDDICNNPTTTWYVEGTNVLSVGTIIYVDSNGTETYKNTWFYIVEPTDYNFNKIFHTDGDGIIDQLGSPTDFNNPIFGIIYHGEDCCHSKVDYFYDASQIFDVGISIYSDPCLRTPAPDESAVKAWVPSFNISRNLIITIGNGILNAFDTDELCFISDPYLFILGSQIQTCAQDQVYYANLFPDILPIQIGTTVWIVPQLDGCVVTTETTLIDGNDPTIYYTLDGGQVISVNSCLVPETPTPTPTPFETPTPTVTQTNTYTPSITTTPTNTYTPSITTTQTNTYTPSITRTQTPTVTQTNTYTPSTTTTQTPTRSGLPQPTPTVTTTTTHTPSQTSTIPNISPTPSRTPGDQICYTWDNADQIWATSVLTWAEFCIIVPIVEAAVKYGTSVVRDRIRKLPEPEKKILIGLLTRLEVDEIVFEKTENKQKNTHVSIKLSDFDIKHQDGKNISVKIFIDN